MQSSGASEPALPPRGLACATSPHRMLAFIDTTPAISRDLLVSHLPSSKWLHLYLWGLSGPFHKSAPTFVHPSAM
jgi:hypothetical protein